MFMLPKTINNRDRINITGILRNNPGSLTVSLITGNASPDYQNIPFSFEATFPNNVNNEDKIVLKRIVNGSTEIIKGDYQNSAATDYFTDDSEFTFGLALLIASTEYGDVPLVEIYANESFLYQMELKHNLSNIRYLSVNGDIEKVAALEFKFY